MAGVDLSKFGDPAPEAVDLSAYGEEPAARTAPQQGKHSLVDDVVRWLGQTYGPGNAALSQSVPGQADFARSLVAGVPGGVARAVKGVGSAVDAADRLLMSPEEREAFDYGQRAIGPAPTFSRTVAPVAAVPQAARNAIAPKVQGQGDQIGEGLGSTGAMIGAALVNPLIGAGAFGATGAQEIQDDANRLGVGGTPRADAAVLGNAGVQSMLGLVAPAAITGRLPLVGASASPVGRLLGGVAGNALLGAAMPAAENAIVKGTYDPSRPLMQGVPESAAQMAVIGSMAHIAHGAGEPLPPGARRAGPDLSKFGEPANDVAPPSAPESATVGPLAPVADVAPTDFPGDWAPPPAPPAPTASQAATPDITDRALDVLRSGGKVSPDQGPSLVDFLSRNGGLQDTGGELAAMDADRWHRDMPFRSRLVQPTGRTLSDAAQSAYEAGYFPDVAPPRMDGSDNMQAIGPDHLLGAIRDELFGKPRYARQDSAGSELAQHVDDLDQITQELGIDPRTTPNAEIKSAIDAYFSQPDRRLGMRAGPLPASVLDGLHETIAADAAKAEGRSPLTGDNGALSDAGLFDPRALQPTDTRPQAEQKLEGLFGDIADKNARAAEIAGASPREAPIARYRRQLADIESGLPAVKPEMTRLWRGNRPDEVGRNPKFTNDAAGIALPFRESYGGPLSFVDVRTADLPKYESKAGAAPGAEFMLPRKVAAQAQVAAQATHPAFAAGKLALAAGGADGVGEDAARAARDERLQSRLAAKQPVDLSAYGDAAKAAGHVVTGLRAAPRTGAVPAPDVSRIAQLDHTISGLAQQLRTALGLTHRQGRLTLRGAAGEYDTKTGVVRTKSVQELDVLSHEAIHALEGKGLPHLTAALRANEADLKKLAYPGAAMDALREEGFAEFGRWYLTNPDYARKVAPAFYTEFEQALTHDAPTVLKSLQGIQAAYRELLRAPSAAVARTLVVEAVKPSPIKDAVADVRALGIRGAVEKWGNELYRRGVDDLHPVQQAVRQLLQTYAANTGRRLDLKAAENPYALARLSRGAYAKGHMDVMHGVTPYHTTEPEGPSIPDALHKAFGHKGWNKDAFGDFGAYLVSRRLVHEWARYEKGALDRPPDKFSRETHEQAIKDFEAGHPTWRDAAAMVYRWNENLWKLERDAGFITNEAYTKGVIEHPDYAPLQRDMSDRSRVGGGGATGNGKYAGGTRAFKGSTRDVINPIQSMMQRAYNLSALTARNDVIKALDDLAEKTGLGSGAIVERLPAHEMQAINVDAAEAVEKAAKDAGLSPRDVTTLLESVYTTLEGHTETTLFRAGDINDRGEPILYLWKGGKKIPLRLPDGEFGQHMFESLSGMNRAAKNLFVQIASAPSRLLRLGVTTQPEFFFSNYIRDQMANWILTDVGFKPFLSGARGIADELRQTGNARLYNTVGGISGGANVASLDHARVNKDFRALNHKGEGLRRFASFDGLIKASEISETGSRLGLFRLAYKQALGRGLSEYEAAVEAAFTARDALDFDRRGSNMVSAIRTITFLNASLQGLDKARRALTAEGQLGQTIRATVATAFGDRSRPVTPTEKQRLILATKAWAKIAALGVFGLSLTAHYRNDKEYEEIPDYLRATHWMVKGPGGEWLAVPKPFELAAASNIMERGYEAWAKHDPTAWGRLVQGLGEILVPPHEITALAVPFQIGANRNAQGVPIVPDHLRYSVAPEFQFNSYTSQLSRRIGKAVGVAPAVIDYLITGFGGSWGRTFLSATDSVLHGRQAYNGADPADMFIARRFIRDVTRGSTSSKEFWDLTSQSGGQLTQDVGTFRQLMNEGRQPEATAYLNKLPPPERAFVVVSAFGSGGDKKLQPLARAGESVKVIGDLRRDIASGPIRGPQNTEIKLSQAERTKVDEALSYLTMSEMRNALIATGFQGWQQKQPIPRSDALQRIYAVSPPVAATLNMRMQVAGVVPPEEAERVDQLWMQNRDRIAAAASSPALGAAMAAKEFKGRAGAMRVLRTPPSAMPHLPRSTEGSQ